MGAPTPDTSSTRRIDRLEQIVALLQQQLQQLRSPELLHDKQVWWGKTKLSSDDSPTYPDSTGGDRTNVFRFNFVDSHFPKTAGEQTREDTDRADDGETQAFGLCPGWLPENVLFPVFRKRGIGGPDKGEHFFFPTCALMMGVVDGSGIAASSSTVAQGGTVTARRISSSDTYEDVEDSDGNAQTFKAFNLSGAAIAADARVVCGMDIFGTWWVLVEMC